MSLLGCHGAPAETTPPTVRCAAPLTNRMQGAPWHSDGHRCVKGDVVPVGITAQKAGSSMQSRCLCEVMLVSENDEI